MERLALRRTVQRLVSEQGGVSRVAERLSVHRSTVYRLLRGETRLPHRLVRVAIARLERGEEKDSGTRNES